MPGESGLSRIRASELRGLIKFQHRSEDEREGILHLRPLSKVHSSGDSSGNVGRVCVSPCSCDSDKPSRCSYVIVLVVCLEELGSSGVMPCKITTLSAVCNMVDASTMNLTLPMPILIGKMQT